MEFEWDDAKAERNAAAHGVTFGYATRVFLDPYRLEIPDNRRAYGEASHRHGTHRGQSFRGGLHAPW